jgi:rare lipoprotein A
MTRTLLLALMALSLSACVTSRGGYYQDDGPHDRPRVDVSKVPDAVPRNDPVNQRNSQPYSVFGVTYRPLASARGYRERGVASWYGKKFDGKLTSNGERYDMYAMTAAHKTLPLPSYVRVRNLNNGQSVIVRVNDRGPFRENRLIDLSYAAAARLGIIGTGTGIVEVEGLSADEPVTQVASRPTLPDIIPKAVASDSPRLYLQLGAFSLRENAESLRNRLLAANLKPVHIEPGEREGAPVWRVRLGPVASVEESDQLGARVQAQGMPAPIVIVEQ